MKKRQYPISIILSIIVLLILCISKGFAQAPAVPNWQTMSYTYDGSVNIDFMLGGSEAPYKYNMSIPGCNTILGDTAVDGTGSSISIPIQQQAYSFYQAVYTGRTGVNFEDGTNTGHIVIPDSVVIGDAINTDTGFTISTLINRTINGTDEVIFDSKEHIFLRLTDQNKLQLGIRLADQSNIWLDADYTPYSGQWTYITAAVEGRNMKIFVNGELVAEQTIGSLIDLYVSEANHQVHLGKFVDATARSFQGKMAYFSFWSEGPTNGASDHILRRDQIRYTGNEQRLEVLYRFNQSTSDTDVHNAANSSANPASLNGLMYSTLNDLHLPITDIIKTPTTTTYYVDRNATGNNAGCSWTHAYTDLQTALNAAVNNDTIKVASGTYHPLSKPNCSNCPTDDRLNYFLINKNITVLGSYDPQNDQPDYDQPSFLSGEIGDPNDQTDNINQILMLLNADDISLHGLTIERGYVPNTTIISNIDGTAVVRDRGAGAFIKGVANVSISNCAFRNNHAGPFKGAGAIYSESQMHISQSVFEANQASTKGGAIEINSNAQILFDDVKFKNNGISTSNGGAIYIRGGADVNFSDCHFSNNVCTNRGGTVYTQHGLKATNCVFEDNIAKYGGAIHSTGVDPVMLSACVFSENNANFRGGALDLYHSDDVFIVNSIFYKNRSNLSNGIGGNIYSSDTEKRIINSTFYGGASSEANGIFCGVTDSTVVYNCIFYGQNDDWGLDPSAHLFIDYSLVDESIGGENNIIGADPIFYDVVNPAGQDTIWRTGDDGLRLFVASPLIESGNSSLLPTDIQDMDNDGDILEKIPFDIADNQRIMNATVDLGAYENQTEFSVRYVKQTATGTADGSSWANASDNLQAMVDSSSIRGTIHIGSGTYQYGNQINIDKALSIKGGYPPNGGVQDIANNPTILDGNNTHRIINATHDTATLVLEGLTIQKGYVDETHAKGGGIYTQGSVELNFCKIKENQASSTIVRHSGNPAIAEGGGIYGKKITVANSEITQNTVKTSNSTPPQLYTSTTSKGGGIYGTTITLTNCIWNQNKAKSSADGSSNSIAEGGGIYGTTIVLSNCLGTENNTESNASLGESTSKGGSIYGNVIFLTNSHINHSYAKAELKCFDTVFAEGGGIYGNMIKLTNSHVTQCKASAIMPNCASSTTTSYIISKGGGIYGDIVTLRNSHILENIAEADRTTTEISSSHVRAEGGGIFGNTITLIKCLINENAAKASADNSTFAAKSKGGGIRGTTINITHCQINQDSALSMTYSVHYVVPVSYSKGGAIYGKSIGIANSTIIENIAFGKATCDYSFGLAKAYSYGGGIYADTSDVTLSNSITCRNSAYSYPWAFYGIETEAAGGGIYGSSTLENSIIWLNTESTDGGTTDTLSEHEGGVLSTSYSLIKGRDLTSTNGFDAISSSFDPMFVSDTLGGNYRLQAQSPLVNAGLNDYVVSDNYDLDMNDDTNEYIPYDIDSLPRIQGWTVDIGAYEYDSQDTLFVDHTAVGDSTGRTWTDAAVGDWDIMDFATSRGFEVVHIAEGNYSMQKSTNIYSNFKVRGGFPNGGGTPNAGLHFTSLSYPANTPILINAENHEVFIRGLQLIDPSNDVLEFDVKAGELELREVEVE